MPDMGDDEAVAPLPARCSFCLKSEGEMGNWSAGPKRRRSDGIYLR